MHPIAKLITGLLLAAAGTGAVNYLMADALNMPLLFAIFAVVTVAATFISSVGATDTTKSSSSREAPSTPRAQAPAKTSVGAGDLETGSVKWFNANKGFGFIVRDNGEEIFVHFRSISGEGRRSLRDGQAVQFRVTHTDKGPQAEEVEAID